MIIQRPKAIPPSGPGEPRNDPPDLSGLFLILLLMSIGLTLYLHSILKHGS